MSRKIAIGDIHGCIKSLKGLLENKIRIQTGDQIIFIGDYIDRGPDPKGVLDYLIQLKESGHNLVFIRGNHEEMLIESFSSKFYFQSWINNGGGATLDSFGISQEEFLMEGNKKFAEKYLDFLSATTYFIETEQCYIVHAGFNFHDKRPFEDLDAMIWSRDFEYDRGLAKGKRIIHGHTPVTLENIKAALFDSENSLINIDAGCVYTEFPGMGNLVGLNIENMQLFVQNNIE